MKKYLVEFIGTFFLVATIGLAVLPPQDVGGMAPVAIASVLIAMIYAGGHVSGAHYNPAVTMALCFRGRCTPRDGVGYVIAQVLAAAAGAVIALTVKGAPPLAPPPQPPLLPPLLAEFLFTFALVFVILNVATAKGTSGNPYYGAAVGLLVLGGAYAVGEISGAVFNPAVAVGITMMGLAHAIPIWVYLVANLLGAAAATAAFGLIESPDE